MTLPVFLTDAAEQDQDEITEHFFGKHPDLGLAFHFEVHDAYDRIAAYPESHQEIEDGDGVRRVVTRTFPYSVFYIVEPARTVVIAVLRGSRNPDIWKQRQQDHLDG